MFGVELINKTFLNGDRAVHKNISSIYKQFSSREQSLKQCCYLSLIIPHETSIYDIIIL